MSVGIEDADFNKYVLVPFNLEAMKLSAYYKRKGEIVVLAPAFVPERHQLFLYRKDYNDRDFPIEILSTPNVQYGGLAFSNNQYYAMPEEIERMKPDTSLYTNAKTLILKQSTSQKQGEKIFNNMIEGEHCRISLDGKTVWPNLYSQFKFLPSCKNLLIHDYDLGQIEGSFEAVKEILDRARHDGCATKIGMKFPIQVYKGQDLLNWSGLNANSTFYSLQYNGVIDNESFMKWIGNPKARAVYTQMDYMVTSPQYSEKEFVMNLLPQIYKQVIISRSYHTFFSLKYDEEFFSDKRWINVLKLFNFFMYSMKSLATSTFIKNIEEDTLYEFAKHADYKKSYKYKDEFIISEIRDIFNFVRENNYPLFQAFYEVNSLKLGGKL